jgi:signal transduction histidine kinase
MVSGIVLLQVVTQWVTFHDVDRLVFQLIVTACGIPLIASATSLVQRTAAKRQLRPFAVVLVAMVIAIGIGALVTSTLWLALRGTLTFQSRTPWSLSRALTFGGVWGATTLGLWALAFVFPQSIEHEKLRLESEKLKAAAEVARLRSHLEPHFLLNTLNAIAGLVTEDPKEARNLLAALGDLLRDALKNEAEVQSLDAEVAWLRRYAKILEARNAPRLSFRWDVEPAAGEVTVPRLLLQPLLENAIKHGALRARDAGEVSFSARVEGGRLRCVIEDNGPGAEGPVRDGAFGLHAVRRRLALAYGDLAELRLETLAAGTRSIVELPLAPVNA